MARNMINNIIDAAPEEALPTLVTKGKMREIAHNIIQNMTTKQMVDMMILSYSELQQIFNNVSKDWILERAGAIKRTKYAQTRKALEEARIVVDFE